MSDDRKSKEQLIAELQELRRLLDRDRVLPETDSVLPETDSVLPETDSVLPETDSVLPETDSVLPETRTAAALCQVAPLGIHECDTEGRITFVNPSQEVITGFTTEELVGTHIFDRLVPGPEKELLPDYLKHLLSQQPPPTPFFARNLKKNGDEFDARFDWTYIRDDHGEVVGFVSIVTDVTQLKQAELDLRKARGDLEERVEDRTAELRASSEQLRVFKDFAEASAQGFAMTDMEGRIVYGNAAFARLVGKAGPEECCGKPPSTYYSSQYQSLRDSEIVPVLERGGVWQGELAMVSATGERIPVLQTTFALLDQQERPLRIRSSRSTA